MRGKTFRGTWLLGAVLVLLPATARAEQPVMVPFNSPITARGQAPDMIPSYAPPDHPLPVPLGSTRPEDGGLYVWAEALLFHQPNKLQGQQLAVRGFVASDISLGVQPGTFIGSSTPALNVNNLQGQDSYQPGMELGIGYKFKDGSSLSFSWFYLTNTNYSSAATLAAPFNNTLVTLADSFLTAPVFNFPPEYSGPPGKIQFPGASPFAAYGIWNGANIMTLQYQQRFQQWDITYRYPVIDSEDYRLSAVLGPRYAWIWEGFTWRTTSQGVDTAGNALSGPEDVGTYTNVTSNRMYGAFAGCQNECYIGHGFAVMVDTRAALLLDSVKEIAKYETALKFQGFPERKRAKADWSVVPQFTGTLSMQWYPTEFIQIQVGYELMYFMNTLTSGRPVDFNYGNDDPHWNHVNRLFDGWRAGIAFWF
jgi:hypothetical protein